MSARRIVLAVALLTLALNAPARAATLSTTELRDKVAGGWYGAVIAGGWGRRPSFATRCAVRSTRTFEIARQLAIARGGRVDSSGWNLAPDSPGPAPFEQWK